MHVRSIGGLSVVVLLLVAGCGDDDSDAGAGSGGSSGAAGTAAGSAPDSGRPQDSGMPPKDAGGDGGSGDRCTLPPASGPCRAAIPRYYHDAASGECKRFTYGGCQGNANNFETQAECEAACGASTGGGTACEVNGKTYPSGTDGITDPFSCNQCQCDDGQLICTEIACAVPCPDGTTAGKSCSRCGPADGCEVLRTGCLPECEEDADCAGTGLGQCFDGICRILCG